MQAAQQTAKQAGFYILLEGKEVKFRWGTPPKNDHRCYTFPSGWSPESARRFMNKQVLSN